MICECTTCNPAATTVIPITGQLVAAAMNGFVVESKYIQGGYIVVQTEQERDQLLSKEIYEDNQVLINGSPVYVAEDKKTWRYDAANDSWVEDTVDISAIQEELQALQTAIDSKVDEATVDQKINQALENIDLSEYYTKEQADEKFDQKQDVLVSGQSIATINNESLLSNKNFILGNVNEKCGFEDLQYQEVGGLTRDVGSLKDFTYEQLFKAILYGVKVPVLTAPSVGEASLTSTKGIAGGSFTATGTFVGNRGTIEPAYGTDGYRVGEFYNYTTIINDEETVGLTVEIPSLLPGVTTVKLRGYYQEGPQPKNNLGADYDQPYPAGYVEAEMNVVGLTAAFTGTVESDPVQGDFSIDLIPVNSIEYTKQGLYGQDGNIAGYQVVVPASTAADPDLDPQVILLPQGASVTGVMGWDALNNKWSWFNGTSAEETVAAQTFIKTGETVTKVIDGVSVVYDKYVYNIDVYGAMGENYFRLAI